LLRDAVRREVGMTQSHWWCANPLELLVVRLRLAGREAEAQIAEKELENWLEATGGVRTDQLDLPPPANPERLDRCEDELCRWRALLGDDVFESWLSANPPLQYFNFPHAAEIAEGLIAAGLVEEGRRLAALAARASREFAGPKGGPTTTPWVVHLFALSGDVATALDYAEQVGPKAFFMFGVNAKRHFFGRYQPIEELESNPRWIAFRERCKARWMEEVEKFDQLLASGEIVLPFPVPGPDPGSSANMTP
jgi:hypothetical protein